MQFKKHALLKVSLLRGCFSRFLNCTNGTKLCKASHLMKYLIRIKVFISFIIAKSFILIGKFVQCYRCGLINTYLILMSHQHITHSPTSSSSCKSIPIYFLLKMCYRDMKTNIPLLKSAHLLMKVSNILSLHETHL